MEPRESATPGRSSGTIQRSISPLGRETEADVTPSPTHETDESVIIQSRLFVELQTQFEKEKQLMEEKFNRQLSEMAQAFSLEKDKALKFMEKEFQNSMQQQAKELGNFKSQLQGQGRDVAVSHYSKLIPSKIEKFAGLPGEDVVEWTLY